MKEIRPVSIEVMTHVIARGLHELGLRPHSTVSYLDLQRDLSGIPYRRLQASIWLNNEQRYYRGKVVPFEIGGPAFETKLLAPRPTDELSPVGSIYAVIDKIIIELHKTLRHQKVKWVSVRGFDEPYGVHETCEAQWHGVSVRGVTDYWIEHDMLTTRFDLLLLDPEWRE